MNPLDRLSEYLGIIERRLRWLTLSRGAAATAAAALGLTVVAVLAANYFAFSNPSVMGARVFLFLGLAFALAAAREQKPLSLWWYVMLVVLALAVAESLLGNRHLSVDKEAA